MTDDNFQEQEQHFAMLKSKYQVGDYEDLSPSSPLYSILKRLDAEKQLSNEDVDWLKSNELETLTLFQQQESEAEAKFVELKAKYQATKHSDLSVSSPLYQILQHLDADLLLSESELHWLTTHELEETFELAKDIEKKQHFAELKKKYKATEYKDLSPSSHLYRVLKQLDSKKPISQSDINFLSKRKLTETIALAVDEYVAILRANINAENQLLNETNTETDEQRQDEAKNLDTTTTSEEHFAALRTEYEVSDYQDKSPSSRLHTILQKLENFERLKPTDVAWLTDKHLFYSDSKIFAAYHKIEANFYEQEYKRTGNKWNLPSASSHWRRAKEQERALTLTDNLNFDEIKENKLKSALLTTRGGAFRDIGELDDAEQCAQEAIEHQPSSHHPYTLMGAIFYERREYSEGDHWFNQAIEQGASPRDIDAEMKRILKNADKDKRREVVEHLLKKEPVRYKWTNTLMGTLCYERGEYSEGDYWFEEAVKHDPSLQNCDAEMRRILKNANKNKRQKIAAYLLAKNPKQYQWAKSMLNDNRKSGTNSPD